MINNHEMNVNNNEKAWIMEIHAIILDGKTNYKDVIYFHIFDVIPVIIWAWFLMKLDKWFQNLT